MKCPSEIELNDYIKNRLPTRRRWELQGHLRICRRCQAELQTLAQSTEYLDALWREALSSTEHPSLENLAALREKRLSKSQQAALLAHLSLCPECAFIFGHLPRQTYARIWERHWQPLAAAASFLLVLAVAIVAWQQGYISRSDVPLSITQHYERMRPSRLEIPSAEKLSEDKANALGKGATEQGEANALPADKASGTDSNKPVPVAQGPSRAPAVLLPKTTQRRPAFPKPPARYLPPEKRIEKSQQAWPPEDGSKTRIAPLIPSSGRRIKEKSLLSSQPLSVQPESVKPRLADESAQPAVPEPPPLAPTIQASAPAPALAPMAASKAISPDMMETKRFGAAPSSRNVLGKAAWTTPVEGKPKLSVAPQETMRAQPLQAPLAPAKAMRGAGLAPEQTSEEECARLKAQPVGEHNPLAIVPLALAELKNERIAKDYIKDLNQ